MPERQQPERGLPSIRRARELRAARKDAPAVSGKFWLWAAVAAAAVVIFYWKRSQTENEAYRARVLTKQREVAARMGPLFFPLRDRVESWTRELAAVDPLIDELAPGAAAAAAELIARPGIYLRLARPDAATPEALRAAAVDSLKDAFESCFLRSSNGPDPHGGAACRSTKQCTPGLVCNEYGHCGQLGQPYNLRVAYRGTRVLNDAWVHEVEVADDELRLRVFDNDLSAADESDIPVAIDLLKRSQYFLVVVDEVPPGAHADPADKVTLEDAVQAEVHPSRVALYDLRAGKQVFRVRRVVDVAIPVVQGDIAAQRRQVLNCELGRDVRRVVGLGDGG